MLKLAPSFLVEGNIENMILGLNEERLKTFLVKGRMREDIHSIPIYSTQNLSYNNKTKKQKLEAIQVENYPIR